MNKIQAGLITRAERKRWQHLVEDQQGKRCVQWTKEHRGNREWYARVGNWVLILLAACLFAIVGSTFYRCAMFVWEWL